MRNNLTFFVKQSLLAFALTGLSLAASAGVCTSAWDGDKIANAVAGKSSYAKIALGSKDEKKTEITVEQIRAFQEAKDRISRVVGLSPVFKVCGDREPNAFATAGPKGEVVAVTVGMLQLANGDPDMAAAVIGHEFGHHVKRHGESSQAREAALGVLGLIAGVALEYNLQKNQGISGVGVNLGQVGSSLVSRKFDRDQEREADDLGFQYMVTAGFNPNGAIRLADKFNQLGQGGGGWFFDSHPGWAERGDIFRTKIASSRDAQRIIASATPKNTPQAAPASGSSAVAAFSPTYQASEAQKSFQSGEIAIRSGKPGEAFEHFKTAATLDYPQAQWAVGTMYKNGVGVPVNKVEAISWYRKAAAKGLPEAMVSLGLMYEAGEGVAQSDSEATSWYSKALELGYPNAMVILGIRHEIGRGGPKDAAKAFELYKMASQKNYPAGHFHLSRAYSQGVGTEKNPKESHSLLVKASDMGFPEAQVTLGIRYLRDGPDKNPEAGVALFTAAAKSNFKQAFYQLGGAYESGTGVVKDLDVAYDCYARAARLGIKEAEIALTRVGALQGNRQAKNCIATASPKPQEGLIKTAEASEEPALRLAYINSQRLIKELSSSPNSSKEQTAEIINRANVVLKSIGEKYGLSFILQDVVWVSASLDITPYVISILKNKAIEPPAILVEKRTKSIKIGFITEKRIASKYPIMVEHSQYIYGKTVSDLANPDAARIAKNEKVSATLNDINTQIKAYALENGIDIVMQDVVWVTPRIDITDNILERLQLK